MNVQLSSQTTPSYAYKIRDKKTGLFKVKRPQYAKHWDTIGDLYATLGIAKSALKNTIRSYGMKDRLELVRYELREIGPYIEPLL